MLTAIYDKAGTLLMYIDGAEDQVRLNVPDGGRFEEIARLPVRQAPPLIAKKEPAHDAG